MTEPKVSDIVQSLAGHDQGNLFIVLEVSGGYALLADGKLRKRVRPKRKKLKHLAHRAQVDPQVAEKIKGGTISDKEIRMALAIFKAGVQARGGN